MRMGVPAVFVKDGFPYRLPRLRHFPTELNVLVLPLQRDQIAETESKGTGQVWIGNKVIEFSAVAVTSVFSVEFKMPLGVHPPEKAGAHLVSLGYIRVDNRGTAFSPIKNRQVVCKGMHVIVVHLGYAAVAHRKPRYPLRLVGQYQACQISPVLIALGHVQGEVSIDIIRMGRIEPGILKPSGDQLTFEAADRRRDRLSGVDGGVEKAGSIIAQDQSVSSSWPPPDIFRRNAEGYGL